MTDTTATVRITGDAGRWQGEVTIRQHSTERVWRTPADMAHDEAFVLAVRYALDEGAVVTDVRTERAAFDELTDAELRRVEAGEAEIAAGEYVTLDELRDDDGE